MNTNQEIPNIGLEDLMAKARESRIKFFDHYEQTKEDLEEQLGYCQDIFSVLDTVTQDPTKADNVDYEFLIHGFRNASALFRSLSDRVDTLNSYLFTMSELVRFVQDVRTRQAKKESKD